MCTGQPKVWTSLVVPGNDLIEGIVLRAETIFRVKT
jgi:hypothetical protein